MQAIRVKAIGNDCQIFIHFPGGMLIRRQNNSQNKAPYFTLPLNFKTFQENKKSPITRLLMNKNVCDVLLSHPVAQAVPSALRGLTSVFGMGTGVPLSLWSQKTIFSILISSQKTINKNTAQI